MRTISKPVLTIYGRPYCHLCDDMLAALERLRGEFIFLVRVVDVGSDPVLEAKYGELVPVMEVGGRMLCHYFFDAAAVREYLSLAGAATGSC